MLLLVLLAAIGLGPGDSGPLGPVPKPPRIEAAVGDSVPLAAPQLALVARGVVAGGKSQAAQPRPAGPATQPSPNQGSGVALAIAPAHAVAVGAPAPAAPNPPAPTAQPVPAPPSEPAPVLATTPSPSGTGGGQGGPVAAGGPSLESCEGDEYLITITLAPEAEGEEASVEIVLKRFSGDELVDELRLEGDLLDARNLALQLSSEGNCVLVEAAAPEEGSPSDGTSQAVVPAEGTSPAIPDSP